MKKTVRIGVGGPVGSGKTALIEKLCKELRNEYSIGAVTNDIFTKEDAMMLKKPELLMMTGSLVWRQADVRIQL